MKGGKGSKEFKHQITDRDIPKIESNSHSTLNHYSQNTVFNRKMVKL